MENLDFRSSGHVARCGCATWQVPRDLCVHALECLEEGKCPGGDHLVADDKLSFPK